MPSWLLRCYWEMLPRLEARRELAAIQQGHAFTERPLEVKDQRAYIRELKERAALPRVEAPLTLSQLGSFGIEIERG